MATDALHRGIDSAFDAADNVVRGIGKLLGVDVDAGAQPSPAGQRASAPAVVAAARRSAARALPAPAPPFRIIDAIDADTGAVSCVVTNGHATAECPSREHAEAVIDCLRQLGASIDESEHRIIRTAEER